MNISALLILMVEKQASDLYISPGSPVLIKIRGVTRPVNSDRVTPVEAKSMAYDLMSDKDIKTFEKSWEANLGLSAVQGARFRVNVMRQKGQVATVIRLLKQHPPSLDSLNVPEFLADMVLEKRGLVLVAGAAGSGKTTTLAAMIDHRNARQHGHILTIEDPIEYVYEYKMSVVNQREIGTDTKSYGTALKNAMREAPDVILIGEIRDTETMREAITYSETGHLCLATIHASNTIETLDRILNFFSQEQRDQLLLDLSHNLRAVVCQRLLNGKDGNQYPAVEVLRETPYISELIQRGEISGIREAMERNLEENIVTFDQAILDLFFAGKISEEEAISHASSKHNVAMKIRIERAQHSKKSDSLKLK